MWAGELQWSVAGLNSNVQFNDRDLIIRTERMRDLRQLATVTIPDPLIQVLSRGDLSIYVQSGWLRQVEIFPNPGWLVKLMFPGVKRLVQAGQH